MNGTATPSPAGRPESLADRLASLARTARVEHTPCGAGQVTWRRWGAGRPLVLLHGGGGSWQHWVRNIATLAREREVWCPDLPAFGDSADPPPPGDVDAIAAATAAGLDQLLPGPGAFDLAGFSFGGAVGTTVAWQRPGRVRRLALVNVTSIRLPFHDLPLEPWRREPDPLRRRAIHAANLLILMVANDAPDPEAIDLHMHNVERARFNGRAAAASTLIRDRLGALELERVDAVYGERDATAIPGVAAARAALQALRPGLRFVSLPGAGHWVQYEAAAAFDDALRALLAD